MSRDLRVEFRQNFAKHFHSQTLPQLREFENERKTRLFWAVLTLVVAVLLTVLFSWYLYYTNFDWYNAGKNSLKGVLGTYSIIWAFTGIICFSLKKKFENKLKTKCLNSLVKAFGNDFYWGTNANVQRDTIEQSRLFGYFSSISYDDNFTGIYKDVRVDISEVNMRRKQGKSTVTVFKGLLVSFDMNKRFTGQTVIVKKKLFGGSHQGLEKATMEDPEFEKVYDVYSDDQVESRYIITPTFIERYKNIRHVFKTDNVKCSFHNNKILLAIHSSKDFFSIGSLLKPVTDTKQFQILLEEFIAVLSLADVLKLDQKLGL